MIRTNFANYYSTTAKNAEIAEKLFRDLAENYSTNTEITIDTFCTILQGMETIKPVETVVVDIIAEYVKVYGSIPAEERHVSYIDIISDLANNDFSDECEEFYGSFKRGKFNVACARNIMLRAVSFIYNLASIVPDGEAFNNLRAANTNLCKDLIKIACFVQFHGALPIKAI